MRVGKDKLLIPLKNSFPEKLSWLYSLEEILDINPVVAPVRKIKLWQCNSRAELSPLC